MHASAAEASFLQGGDCMRSGTNAEATHDNVMCDPFSASEQL